MSSIQLPVVRGVMRKGVARLLHVLVAVDTAWASRLPLMVTKNMSAVDASPGSMVS